MVVELQGISRTTGNARKFPLRNLVKAEGDKSNISTNTLNKSNVVNKAMNKIPSHGDDDRNDGSSNYASINGGNHKQNVGGLIAAFIVSSLLAIGAHTTSVLDRLGETGKNIVKSALTLAGIFFGVSLGAASLTNSENESGFEEKGFDFEIYNG